MVNQTYADLARHYRTAIVATRHGRIRSGAAKVGPDADTLIDVILQSRPHPEQGFRSAIGMPGLVKRCGKERADVACARALLYKSGAAILKNGMDRTAPPAKATSILSVKAHPKLMQLRLAS